MQVLSGHGEDPGVPLHVLVRVVRGVRDRGHPDQRVRIGLSPGLLLLPDLRHEAPGQAVPYASAHVGLPDHLQRGRDHLQERSVRE